VAFFVWTLALLISCDPAAANPSVLAAGASTVRSAVAVPAGTRVVPDVEVPPKARDVLAEIERRRGEPPPGYVGGRVFGNRERRLPRGSYREYDVHPKVRGQNRGTERIVIERRTGKAYYTPDHYETFVRMN
jgi:ribonuclease T1